MDTILDISSSSGALASGKAAAIPSESTNSETSVTRAPRVIPMRLRISYAAAILQAAAGIFAVLYSLGAVAFGVALLYYTFSR